MNTVSKGPAFRERIADALDSTRRLGLLLSVLVAGVLVVTLAWTHMNPVTFLLFFALVWWLIRQDRMHDAKEDALRLVERRVDALEGHCGLTDDWSKELKRAQLVQRACGGMLSDHLCWPPEKAMEVDDE